MIAVSVPSGDARELHGGFKATLDLAKTERF
jgi:hypothetical protein